MFKNYLKIAIRNLVKHRIYSFINIAGLALGMLCCILILLWVQDELSFDRFHKNGDRLYVVVHKGEGGGWYESTPWAMTPVLKKDFPEIERATRVCTQHILVKYCDRNFYEAVAFVDPDFLHIFTFPMIQGDPESALDVKESIVISEKAAHKYFPGEDPVGKILKINQNTNLTVTGIIKNVPATSTISFEMLVPITNLGEDRLATWSSEYPAFVLLHENVDVNNLRPKMAGTIVKYDTRTTNKKIVDDLYPFANLHLYGLNEGGSILYVYIYSAIALVVLIVACINFINLITAKASVRGKEIGMRKVVGAGKRHIIGQFYGETLLISIIAFMLAFTLAHLILPYFNKLAEKQIVLHFFHNPMLFLGSISIIILTTLFAGSYPALLLSRFRPVRILQESFSTGLKKSKVRWMLVVIQFAVSIILIIMTITMNRQMDYIQNKNLGFNREQVISFNLNEDFRAQFEAMKNRLLQYPGIKNISRATLGPNAILYSNPVYWEGRGPEQYENMSYVVVDYDYLETFEFELVEGRNFSKEFSTDGGNYIVNEAAVKFMHLDSPIGKMFSIWQAEGKIIGVVKNFHSLSLHNEIRPVVMTMIPFMPPTQAFIRISPENTKTTLAIIEDAWKQFAPNYPFQFEFLDDAFKRQYKNEQKIKTLFQAFSALAIFISCIGLFGLAAFIAQRRTKEIGIRKVVGASVWQLLILLTKDFTRWIVVATLIAGPIAWYVMKQWLQNFAYRVEMSWWIYGLAGVMTLGIAWLTICWQAIRVAKANPVESLRYE